MMVDAVINVELFGDVLVLGCASFIGGVLMPLLFRMIGYVVDMVRMILL